MKFYKIVLLKAFLFSTTSFAKFEAFNINPSSLETNSQALREFTVSGSQPYVKFKSESNNKESVTLYGDGVLLSDYLKTNKRNNSDLSTFDFKDVGATRLVAYKNEKLGDRFLHIKFKKKGQEKWYVTQCVPSKPCVSISDEICRRFAQKGKTQAGLQSKINQCTDLLDVISEKNTSSSEVKEMDDYIKEAQKDFHDKKGGFTKLNYYLTSLTGDPESPVKNHLIAIRENSSQILGMFAACSQWMQNEMEQEFNSNEVSNKDSKRSTK